MHTSRLTSSAPGPSRQRRQWLVAALGLASSPLLGCGGGGSGSEEPAAAPPPAAPAVLGTPASRFAALADYPFDENYLSVAGLRMHYVDAGPRDAVHTFLCLHGQPTWSYLYRKMIAVFTAAGHRVVAPDWLGFGKSDKPVADSVYTFTFHRDAMLAFVRQLNLTNVTLVVQDWGGLLGLTLPPVMPERFARLLIMNTTFATGAPLSASQANWSLLSQQRRDRWLAMTDVNVPQIMLSASTTASAAVAAAYDAPFVDPRYEAGARRFPVIVPITPNEEGAEVSRQAVAWWGSQWQGRSFMAVGMQDPLLGPEVMREMHKLIRNCPPALEVAEAGHFIQEDAGTRVAEAALRAFA
jgi:haloalkane dehalogenase